MNIPDTKIATILFNFRDYCKTEEGLAETLRKLRDIGYQAVQVCDFHTKTDTTAKAVRELLDANGLYCCSTHENLADHKDHITGASSGVGATLTRRFAAEGNVVCAIARGKERLEKIKDGHQRREGAAIA